MAGCRARRVSYGALVAAAVQGAAPVGADSSPSSMATSAPPAVAHAAKLWRHSVTTADPVSSTSAATVTVAASVKTVTAAAAALQASGVANRFQRWLDKLEHAGLFGHILLVLAFSTWVCFALPVTPVEIAMGFIYGAPWGFACNLLCKATGSCNAFLIAQQLGRRCGWKVPAVLKPRLALLHSRPILTMVGVRLMPLPLGVKNYGLGLCEVKLLHYLLATILVDAPFSALWATAGSSCRSLSEALSYDAKPGVPPALMGMRQEVLIGRVLPSVLLVGLLIVIACRRFRPSRSLETLGSQGGSWSDIGMNMDKLDDP